MVEVDQMETGRLEILLKKHKLWLESGEKQGAQADLLGADLSENDFTNVNLQDAILQRANFKKANMSQTNLRAANLKDADLSETLDLQAAQLAGTDIGGAKLPPAIADSLKESLKHIVEATANAQKQFIAILSGSVYTWLTIGTTRDAALITNSASTPLPGIGAIIPILDFYLVAPLILVSLYFYFLLNLQRLWETLADLPAVFPDGRTLDKKADPWLLNGLVLAHVAKLRKDPPPLFRFQHWLSILLAWGIVPLTVLFVWARFICRHDWPITVPQVVLLAISAGFAFMSYRLARRTLRGDPRQPFLWSQLWRKMSLYAFCVILIAFLSLSWLAIEEVHAEYTPSGDVVHRLSTAQWLENAVYRLSTAELSEVDVSEKTANWEDKKEQYPLVNLENNKEQYPLVKGAKLSGADLRGVHARKAFLINADLRDANLRNANLRFALLIGVDLRGAHLENAYLVGANLEDARLGAYLVGAHLEDADLKGADLKDADLKDADLKGADLKEANLLGVDLSRAKNLIQAQVDSAKTGVSEITGKKTIPPPGLYITEPKAGNP